MNTPRKALQPADQTVDASIELVDPMPSPLVSLSVDPACLSEILITNSLTDERIHTEVLIGNRWFLVPRSGALRVPVPQEWVRIQTNGNYRVRDDRDGVVYARTRPGPGHKGEPQYSKESLIPVSTALPAHFNRVDGFAVSASEGADATDPRTGLPSNTCLLDIKMLLGGVNVGPNYGTPFGSVQVRVTKIEVWDGHPGWDNDGVNAYPRREPKVFTYDDLVMNLESGVGVFSAEVDLGIVVSDPYVLCWFSAELPGCHKSGGGNIVRIETVDGLTSPAIMKATP